MPTTVSFGFTGKEQSWVVPAGVSRITLECYGASGGNSNNIYGRGARMRTQHDVVAGTTLTIIVGGAGGLSHLGVKGGYPDGGDASSSSTYNVGSGGGSTKVTLATTLLNQAGGGGGQGHYAQHVSGVGDCGWGGHGGDVTGDKGLRAHLSGGEGGGAGHDGKRDTPGEGGNGGSNDLLVLEDDGQDGSALKGGNGGRRYDDYTGPGGGGGGGWRGGGGAGAANSNGNAAAGGGGGNSNFSGTFISSTKGERLGHGLVYITFDRRPSNPSFIAPKGGETYDASSVVSWNASSDPDGDAITYGLDYSRDDGATWTALVRNHTTTSYTVNWSSVPSSKTMRLRLFATAAGWNSDLIISNQFTVQHYAVVGAPWTPKWNLRHLANRPYAFNHNVKRATTNTFTGRYSLRSLIADNFVPVYNGSGPVVKDLQSLFRIVSFVGTEPQDFLWRGYTRVGRGFTAQYSGISFAAKTYAAHWSLRAQIADEFAAHSDILGKVTASQALLWDGRHLVGESDSFHHDVVSNKSDPVAVVKTWPWTASLEGWIGNSEYWSWVNDGNPAGGAEGKYVSTLTSHSAITTAMYIDLTAANLGIPEAAQLTYIKATGLQSKATSAVNNNDSIVGKVDYQNPDYSIAATILVNSRTVSGALAELAYTDHSVTGGLSLPNVTANKGGRLQLNATFSTLNTTLGSDIKVLFDNFNLEVTYFIQTASNKFTANYNGAGPVTKTVTVSFNDLLAVGEPEQLSYSLAARIGNSFVARFNENVLIGRTNNARYNVTVPVGDSDEFRFMDLMKTGDSFASVFNTQGLVGDDQFAPWNIAFAVNNPFSPTYNVRSAIARLHELRYRIMDNATKDSVPFKYRILALLGKTHTPKFNVTSLIADDLAALYNGFIVAGNQLTKLWGITAHVFDDLVIKARTRSFNIWDDDEIESTLYVADTTETDRWVKVVDPTVKTFTPDPLETDAWTKVANPAPSNYNPRETS